ncbi:MAG: hypothetical protein LAO21_03510 [Acidobacteriia bacterium]|nr:hypothetical protein [Terriglobia bacterium]
MEPKEITSKHLSPSAQRVQDALKAFGLACAVLKLSPADLQMITKGEVISIK